MTLIHVPRPDFKNSMDPNRPVNTLLKSQIEHLQQAELKLPIGRQSKIYVNAIKTEGEAAEYIRQVTAALHAAHDAAAAARTKPAAGRKRGIEIAAAAESKAAGKPKSTAKNAKNQKRRGGRGKDKKRPKA